jgi:hypothetical protein
MTDTAKHPDSMDVHILHQMNEAAAKLDADVSAYLDKLVGLSSGAIHEWLNFK